MSSHRGLNMWDSVLKTYTVFSIFTVNVCFTAIALPAYCPEGLFGVDCMYQCHCYSGSWCNVDGSCPFPGGCYPGFFGPGCQYRDFCFAQCEQEVPSYVRDRDEFSCNPDSSSTSIDITLRREQIFDWVRIIVNNASSLLEFTVTVNDHQTCKNEKRLVVEPKTVDVVCDNTHLLRKITLTGPAVKHICTANVSGGRNVAWRQFANQSSTDIDVDDPGDAFNAVSNLNYPTNTICSRTRIETNPYWQLIFNRPQIITEIIIITRNDGLATLRNVVVTMRDSTSLIALLRSKQDVEERSYSFTSLQYLPVTSLRIAAERMFRICYVQTYGETVCPEGSWGLACEKDCNCSSTQICNGVNGVCHAPCPFGYYSYKCSWPCLENCGYSCLKQTGRCRKECPRGKFGQSCSSVCPDDCLNSICELRSGTCLACVRGRSGTSCTTQCPEDCMNNTCEFRSGQCPECRAGKFGEYCTELCPSTCRGAMCDKYTGDCTECNEGYYGPNCTQACSRLCAQHQCKITSGVCLACRNGQVPNCTACPPGNYGNNCSLSCPQFCQDGLCDIDRGYCLACQGDRKVPFCQDTSYSVDLSNFRNLNIWFWILIALLPVVGLLIFGLLAKMKLHEKQSESMDH